MNGGVTRRGVSMDVSAIASMATQIKQGETAQAVQFAVLKKAMEVEEQSAMQLLQTLPSNPSHLGNGVDTVA
ncbi:YjfB family protein [Azonexus sp.]|uniref:YjfB family protein n=1 Tax=Azonexus sp. TaxID=1872668 RepID=UPI0027BA047A|nr:YjfB family protein [Azonexus sp.]